MKNAKEIREKKGLSQEQVGKKVGISQETLSQYENGSRKPSLEIARKIAKVYKVSLDNIFFGNDISK